MNIIIITSNSNNNKKNDNKDPLMCCKFYFTQFKNRRACACECARGTIVAGCE